MAAPVGYEQSESIQELFNSLNKEQKKAIIEIIKLMLK